MAITEHKRFTGYPAVFSGITISDVQSVSPAPGVQKMVLTPDGSIQPAVAVEIARDPRIGLTCFNLGHLTTIPMRSCLRMSSALIQFQARATGGAFAGNGSHVTLVGTIGDLYVESIRAQQDEQSGALLTLQYVPLYDGTNPILACNVGQSLTGTPQIQYTYRLGPTVIDGTQIRGVQSAQFTTGINYSTKRGDGDKFARIGSIQALAETLEIGFDNLELINTIGFGAKAISSGVTQYFIRNDSGPADANHFSITINAGLLEITDASQSGNEDAGPRLMVTAARDNAAAVSYTVGTALPA